MSLPGDGGEGAVGCAHSAVQVFSSAEMRSWEFHGFPTVIILGSAEVLRFIDIKLEIFLQEHNHPQSTSRIGDLICKIKIIKEEVNFTFLKVLLK